MARIFVRENNYDLVRIDKSNWQFVTIDTVVNQTKTTMFFPQVNTVAAASYTNVVKTVCRV